VDDIVFTCQGVKKEKKEIFLYNKNPVNFVILPIAHLTFRIPVNCFAILSAKHQPKDVNKI
jgi:hypothetical protein